MKYTAGFIGAGNMGSILAQAVYKTDKKLAIYDTDEKKVENLLKSMKNAVFEQTNVLAKNCEFVFLAVKPDVVINVAKSIKNSISRDTVIVTMAAGVSLADISSAAGTENVIRIMPNTPAAVGEGMILYCTARVSEEAEKKFLALMSKAGTTDKLEEKNFDAAAALSGCGPAFVYMFAKSLADGAVACGVQRKKAMFYAAQTILGSAEMLLKSGKDPELLKDEVCSPGGTTIAGVLSLEEAAFRAAAADAVVASYERTLELKK
ncbi:MAG: pyrroline-5-carboxylate reductase [Clostridiales bacterium]|nr:pyrroline-5-carboxylate reductase [Candidatus Equinaster intestinalis]